MPTDLTRAVIVDIDGTVARHVLPDGKLIRGHYEYRLALWDLPNRPIIDAVLALRDAGFQPVFCSGRPRLDRQGYDVEEATRNWLGQHVGHWGAVSTAVHAGSA